MIGASKSDALLVLKKWRESSALVRIILRSSAGILNAVGIVGGSDEGLELGDMNTWRFSTSIEGASFKFGTPAEAPASVRSASLEKYESLLEVTLATGERLALIEIKELPLEVSSV